MSVYDKVTVSTSTSFSTLENKPRIISYFTMDKGLEIYE